jgi:hypothetical protein
MSNWAVVVWQITPATTFVAARVPAVSSTRGGHTA